jgi:hypothetical protein
MDKNWDDFKVYNLKSVVWYKFMEFHRNSLEVIN